MMSLSLFRKKLSIDPETDQGLRRCLTAFDLILLGIGAIVGAGIFVLTGIAAATKAGPSLIISYIIAGFASAFTALSYAELASSIRGCGSAYSYAYAGLGELAAWIIGWDLLLEYSIAVAAVAVGWSAYFNNFLTALGIHIPPALLESPFRGGIINLPAVLIVIFLGILLGKGSKESARFNAVIVATKLTVVFLFIILAARHFDINNWHPFMPFGWNGIMHGAAIIFFSYIGFDAVSTAAEEAIKPERSLPIGIIGSLIACTILYIVVAGVLTGMTSYTTLNVASPIADVLLRFGYKFAAGLIAIGAIAGLTTVILVMYYGLTRVFLAISRDDLLPRVFAHINPRTKTPLRIIVIGGIVTAVLAGFVPMEDLVEMVNIGTLAAFVIVCGGVIVLRRIQPGLLRPFKTPLSPYIPFLGILSCLYLMFNLTAITWIRFIIWMLIGLLIYFIYGQNAASRNFRSKPSS